MKIRRIYNENENIKDMSKDRIHLDLSYNEWRKIYDLIDLVRFGLSENPSLKKKAQNISNCIKNAQELKSIWINKEHNIETSF